MITFRGIEMQPSITATNAYIDLEYKKFTNGSPFIDYNAGTEGIVLRNSRDTNTPNTQVIHFGFRHSKACFYIHETLVIRELRKAHTEELLATGKFIILYLL